MDEDCYRQPVPTAPAIGPDDHIYFGELTGFGPDGTGVSWVWRIEPGVEGMSSTTSAFEVVIDGWVQMGK